MGKAWEHLSCEWHLVDARWTYGGRGPRSNNALDFIIEHSNDSQDSWGSQDRQYSTLLARFIIYYTWVVDGQCPPYVHLVSTRRHSSDRCSQAFPVFRAHPLHVLHWTKTEEQKMGEAWERLLFFMAWWLNCCVKKLNSLSKCLSCNGY